MTELEKDMRDLKDDVLTKRDAKAAVQIVAEIVGLGAVIYLGAAVISTIFGPAGVLACGAGTAKALYVQLCKAYCDLPKDQRRVVAKLAKAMTGIWGRLG